MHLARAASEVLFLISLIALLGRELYELHGEYKRTGSARGYFDDFRNAIDLGGYAVHCTLVPAWAYVVAGASKLDIRLRFDTHDNYATSRITRAGPGVRDLLKFMTQLDEVEA